MEWISFAVSMVAMTNGQMLDEQDFYSDHVQRIPNVIKQVRIC